MIRLFLSLYFAICLGLVAINLTSNLLFEHLQSDSDINSQIDIHRIAQIVQGFKNLEEPELSKVLKALPFQTKILTSQQLQLLPEQQTTLAQGEALTLFESGNRLSVYIRLNENAEANSAKLLHISGIELTSGNESNSVLSQVIILLSYLLLGLFVLAWSRPLWRDLTLLKQASEQIQQGDFEITTKVSRRSVIYPVVHSFNLMATKISELVSNQQQMTHAVSHDIRTPLARIKFSLAILKQQPELIEQTSEDMLEDVAEIDQLTSELLTFAKLENEQSVRMENVNLHQLLANLAEKLSRNSGIQLNTYCDEETWFQCDGYLIERCLQNLITNGFKYANSKVEVYIRMDTSSHAKDLTDAAKQVVIEVHDDGNGIAPEHRETVMEAFSRVDDSRNKNTGGFGLGLAIVNKIVGWHKGNIDVDDSPIGGAVIRLTL